MKKEKQVVVVEMTTKENASASWDNPEAMIEKLPYSTKMKGFGGGFFESVEKIREFYSDFQGAEKITGCGEWEVEKKNGE